MPFDAVKLWALLNDDDLWTGVLRSKGFFWVAADHRAAYEWSQAGGGSHVRPMGMWWAAVPPSRWPHPDGARPDQVEGWDPRFGDRQQELVFIGQGINEETFRARLDDCRVPNEVLAADSDTWLNHPNPFPSLEEAMAQKQAA